MLQFDLLKTDPSSHARRGQLTLNHGARGWRDRS
jgi:queuine tRNA-ribosyltransferase